MIKSRDDATTSPGRPPAVVAEADLTVFYIRPLTSAFTTAGPTDTQENRTNTIVSLTGKQLQEVCTALLDAYSSADALRIMVRFELNEKLEAIAGGDNLRVLVFNLATWAEQTGRMNDLIEGAHRQNSGNQVLQNLVQSWASTTPPTSTSAQPSSRTGAAALTEPVTIDLFLSYSRKDLDAMRIVRDSLREAGVSVWTDDGLQPGTPSWRAAIEEAVTQASAMVVVLSPDAKKSQWVGNEVGYAQTLEKTIFPVLVAGDTASSVPISLIRAQWVDGRRDLRRTIIQELRPAILDYLGKPQVAPVAVNIQLVSPPTELPQRQPATVSTIVFDWVTIPASEFLMGSETDSPEKPQHAVYLSRYRIAKYPVTNAQYMEFVKATSHKHPPYWDKGRIPQGKENHPVVAVSWNDAMAFCKWANVRLPTEAEWEKAARGTDGRTYPWGNNPPSKDLCNFDRNVGDTTPVDAYPAGASPYGVMDMAGNVWEWTSSLYLPYPYWHDIDRENAKRKGRRVLRGGSWLDAVCLVRSANRDDLFPISSSLVIGFRLVSIGT